MSVAERLGISPESVEEVETLNALVLPNADALFREAFGKVDTIKARAETYGDDSLDKRSKAELHKAQLLLAAAILDKAQNTSEGRLSGALSLISQLVAKADPEKTLGPSGAALRQHLIPNGWIAMTGSWERTRYAWREGLEHLLDANATPEGQAIAQALNEITRLHPADPEPVKVNIQETFPSPIVAFTLSVIGVGLSLRGFVREMKGKR